MAASWHRLIQLAGVGVLAYSAFFAVFAIALFTYSAVRHGALVRSLRAGPFANTSNIHALPRIVGVGDRVSVEEIARDLRRSGYTRLSESPLGRFEKGEDWIEVRPGPQSHLREEPVLIHFANGAISSIVSLTSGERVEEYRLEPRLITNVGHGREQRRLVRFEEIPPVLIHAIVSAEDKRFFQHSGFDPYRIAKAAYIDVRERRKEQGASTLSMQLARSMWLDRDKSWRRKLEEVLITVQLEARLTKEEIFELYANQIYLGEKGTYSIHGFGAAAQVYFGKDIRQLTLPEAALLAGLPRRPSFYNPARHPSRAIERRNYVLGLMLENRLITHEEYVEAMVAPLELASESREPHEAAYFVDLVQNGLREYRGRDDRAAFQVYSTLDLDLQRAAEEAVASGMRGVDELLRWRQKAKGAGYTPPQVALVALDPQTGEIRALVGGRHYEKTQLNRAVARRQPGSVFKPFVYAAALNTAVRGGARVFTPSSTVVDEPTTFWFDEKPYDPENFGKSFSGTVTLRRALAKSLNVATVKVAEDVGLQKVVDLARKAGLNGAIQATPSVALGAYEVTPIKLAGAYTIFPTLGQYSKPHLMTLVRAHDGAVRYANGARQETVLDARVAYLMVNMLEEVMESGTAAGVRGRGFRQPAGGKTGTSRDAWFAGFTSELVCVVWVGYDDGSDIRLEGSKGALPIWTDFMKRAAGMRRYRNAKRFTPPPGVVSVAVDPSTGRLANSSCPARRQELFVAGTQPKEFCMHGSTYPIYAWPAPDPAAPRQRPPAIAESAPIPERAPEAPAPAAPTQRERRFRIPVEELAIDDD
ncbi:MAG: transglycosylase domain-containing protein [Bryobacteraceae bacterium]